MQWSSPNIHHAKVSHIANKILEGKTSLSSLTMIRTTVDIMDIEGLKEVAKEIAMLAVEAIVSFSVHAVDGEGPTTCYHSS